MQVYFQTIEGQVPIPTGTDGLAEASTKFRELKDKALASFGGLALAHRRQGLATPEAC